MTMSEKKNFVIIDIEWSSKQWQGHLPSYHGYFIETLLKNAHTVVSISPNPQLVLKKLNHLSKNERNHLHFFSFKEIKDIVYQREYPVKNASSENVSNCKKNIVVNSEVRSNPKLYPYHFKSEIIRTVHSLTPNFILNQYQFIIPKIKWFISLPKTLQKMIVFSKKEITSLIKIPGLILEHYQTSQIIKRIEYKKSLKKTQDYQERIRFQHLTIQFSEFDKLVNYCIKIFSLNKNTTEVIFPFIDQYMFPKKLSNVFDHALNYPWYCLWVQTQNFGKPNFKDTVEFFNCPNCKGILLLEENKLQIIQSLLPDKKVLHLPDLVHNTKINHNYELAKLIKKQAGEKKIIGLVGRICDSKGLKTFLKTICLKESNKYFFILIGGGKIENPEVINLLNQSSEFENTLYFLSNISLDENFNAVFNLCDIVYAAYKNFPWSSNTLSRAAYFHKPIIVNTGHLMEKRVKEYNLGTTITPDNPEKLLTAIKSTLKTQEKSNKHPIFGFDKFNQVFSFTNFQRAIHSLVNHQNTLEKN